MASSGALSYLTVEPPRALSYGPPAVSSDWIGNLPNDFQQGQQYAFQRHLQTMFAPGTPGAQALQQAGVYPNTLMGQLAQAGGAPAVSQLLPLLLKQQVLQSDEAGPPQQQLGPLSQSDDPRGKIPVIVAAAQKYGHDPATAIRAAGAEGLRSFYGDGGKSGGAFQLYTGGGLGNEFQKETGLNPLDPKNEDAAIDWSMKNLGRTGWGPYKGAAKVGIGRWQGIGQQTAGTQTAAATPQSGLKPDDQAQVDARYPPGGAPAAVGTSPVAGAEDASVEQPPGATPNKPPFMGGGTQPSRVAANNVQSGPSAITLAQAGPATPRRDVSSMPGADQVPAAWLKAGVSPQAYADHAMKLARNHAIVGDAEGAKIWQDRADKILDAIKQASEPTGLMKEAAQVGMSVPDYQQRLKGQELDAAQYSNLHKGLAGAGTVAANSVQYTQAARGLLNDPGFYSGSGEGINLAWKRALAGLGLDPGGALPQEAFRKVMAANILQQVNALKAEAESMGQAGSRIFSSQIDMMQKAAQNPDNSIAANRYLTELAARSANRTMQIADAADDYALSHKALDAGFEKQVRNWIVKNPIFTPQEMAHPQLLSAPTAPPTLRSKEDLAAWGRSLGFKPGDPVRTPDGRLVPLP